MIWRRSKTTDPPQAASGRIHVPATLERLAGVRPVFHSEADFQQALAWQLHLDHPGVRLRLERRPDPNVREAADLWVVEADGYTTAVELKYLVRRADVTVDGERFVLANQGAQDISRYDVAKDVGRVERWVHQGLAARGAVVVLSNDPGYWRQSARATIDAAFRLHDGRTLAGELAWASHAGAGTTRGRSQSIAIRGRYELRWAQYADLAGGQELRYLIIDTSAAHLQ